MTNEEKAKEIGGLCDGCLDERKNLTCQFNCTNAGLYYGALKMADWKDNQLKEEFNVPDYCKTTEEIFNFIGNDVHAHGYNKAKDYDKRFILRKRDELLQKYENTKNESIKDIANTITEIVNELFNL